MEELNKEKEGVLVIKTPSYPNLTLEKLKEIITEIYNQPKVKYNPIEEAYQRMSPENRKLFDDALKNAYNINPRLVHLENKDIIIKTNQPNYINNFNKQINNKPKITNKFNKKKKRK